MESDVSSYILSSELSRLRSEGVKKIQVHINSYGGEVGEGLAIYNELAQFDECETICTGFAASIASVIFMGGKRRVMRPSSLLMIHNAWTYTQGNADELRKTADDLDVITTASIQAYMSRAKVPEETIKSLMDRESWITPNRAFEIGLCDVIEESPRAAAVSQAYIPKWTVNEDGRATDIRAIQPHNPEIKTPSASEDHSADRDAPNKFEIFFSTITRKER